MKHVKAKRESKRISQSYVDNRKDREAKWKTGGKEEEKFKIHMEKRESYRMN